MLYFCLVFGAAEKFFNTEAVEIVWLVWFWLDHLFHKIITLCQEYATIVRMGQKKACIGNEAQSKRLNAWTPIYPIEYGKVSNWDGTGKIWDHAFYSELCVAPNHYPVVQVPYIVIVHVLCGVAELLWYFITIVYTCTITKAFICNSSLHFAMFIT